MKSELTTQPKSNDLRALLASDHVKEQIALALPKHMTSDRMARVALTAINRTPKLLECSPQSVLSCLMSCSAMGIEPDGRNAHLIPYGKECQLIVDYKGLVSLATRNGFKVRSDKVCENDLFNYEVVDGVPKFKHVVDYKKPRGNAYAYYATAVRDGELDVEVMTMDEVQAIRKRSRAAQSGPWVTDFDEMGKKTVLRRMSKRWDITPELRDALDADYDRPREVETVGRVVGPVFNQDSQPVANGEQGDPVTGEAAEGQSTASGLHETNPPAETPKPEGPKADNVIVLDPTPPSNHEVLRDAMNGDSLRMDDINRVIVSAGLAKEAKFKRVTEIPEEIAGKLIKNWDDVLAHAFPQKA